MSDGRPSHHMPGGKFQNPEGSPLRHGTRQEKFKFIFDQVFARTRKDTPDGHVLSKQKFEAQLAAAGNPSVTWLGHSAFIIRAGGKILLTDPFLGQRAGPKGFGPKRYAVAPISGADLPKADVLVVSHNHYDHLDAPTIEAYPHKAETLVIVPLGLGPFFTRRGYSQVIEQDWWDTWQDSGLKIATLPAIHNSGRGLGDQNKTLWASFGIYTEDGCIWFSGDTADGPVFDEVARRAGPFDLVLVAIGAYEPRKLMKGAHINPQEAVNLARKLGAQTAIGMHWGTIRLTVEEPFDTPTLFRKAAQNQGFGAENAITLQVGETRNLNSKSLASKADR